MFSVGVFILYFLRHDLDTLSKNERCQAWFGMDKTGIEDLANNRLMYVIFVGGGGGSGVKEAVRV